MEETLPRSPGEDDLCIPSALRFRGYKGAAQQRPHPQHREKIGGDSQALRHLRMIHAGRYAEAGSLHDGGVLNRFRMRSEIQVMPVIVRQDWRDVLDLLNAFTPDNHL